MKHIKTFKVSSRQYKYLNKKDSIKIDIVARKFIENQNIPGKIEKLKLQDFLDNCLDYEDIFESLIVGNLPFGNDNIYYVIDKFCIDTNILSSAPERRNTLSDIITKLYEEYKIESQLDNKLIEIFEKNPPKYKKCFGLYEKYITYVVKDACQWILEGEKYNL